MKRMHLAAAIASGFFGSMLAAVSAKFEQAASSAKPIGPSGAKRRNRLTVAAAKRASIKRKNVRRHKQHVTRAARRSGR